LKSVRGDRFSLLHPTVARTIRSDYAMENY
jgi:hypothetical protein